MQSLTGEQFSEVFEALQPDISRYLIRRGADRSDVADLVAEVFAIAWQRREALPAGPGLKPWMLVTARYVFNNHVRKSARDDVLLSGLAAAPLDASKDPATHLLAWEQERDVWIALSRLSSDDKELLLLTGWDGLSPGEAASVLSVNAATVRVRLHRARKRFAKELTHIHSQSDDSSLTTQTIDLTADNGTREQQGSRL